MNNKFIFFDVANTLLHKPKVYDNLFAILKERIPTVTLSEVMVKHKLVSETIQFPDKTNREFYTYFNAELVKAFSIQPEENLLTRIFEACTYLDWAVFEDCSALEKLNADMGVISNWDISLPEKLKKYFTIDFKPVICSQKIGYAKPDERIFEAAINALSKKYNSVLFVGDSIKLDIEPAKKIGIQPILIDRLNVYADYTGDKISSLTQLENYL